MAEYLRCGAKKRLGASPGRFLFRFPMTKEKPQQA
jgi:hypothetical protein